MSLQLYNDILNLARDHANVDLLVKIWSDSFKLNKEALIEIDERIVEMLPYLRERVGLPFSTSNSFKEFVEEYDEHQYKTQCPFSSTECLVFFAKRGDLRNIRKALKKGAQNRYNAIRVAAKYNHKNVIDYLFQNIEDEPDLVMRTRIEHLSIGLSGAAEGGHLDLVNFFLEQGAVVMHSVLYSAARNGSLDIINLFHYTTKEDKEAGLEGAARGGHIELVKQFAEGVSDSENALIEAAKGGHLEIVEFLIEKEENLDYVIEAAVEKGHLSVVKYLLSKDDSYVYEAFHNAALIGQLEIVKYLVEKYELNLSQTILKILEEEQFEVFYYLLSNFLNSDLSNSSKKETLEELITTAAYGGHKSVVDHLWPILLSRGIKNEKIRERVLTSVVKGQNVELLEELLREGESVSMTELLMIAIQENVIKFLIGKIDDLNAALLEAIRVRNRKAVRYLLEAGAVKSIEAVREARKRDGRKLDLTILSYLLENSEESD